MDPIFGSIYPFHIHLLVMHHVNDLSCNHIPMNFTMTAYTIKMPQSHLMLIHTTAIILNHSLDIYHVNDFSIDHIPMKFPMTAWSSIYCWYALVLFNVSSYFNNDFILGTKLLVDISFDCEPLALFMTPKFTWIGRYSLHISLPCDQPLLLLYLWSLFIFAFL